MKMYLKKIMISKKIIKEFLKFGIIGLCALIFEACLIFILFKSGFDLKYSRIITIPLALILTWFLNRTITFKNNNPQKLKQYVQYSSLIMLGISLNYLVYLYFLDFFKELEFAYIIALCLGSLSSMFFNFGFSKYFVFNA